jgi:hypothetical protein
MLEMFSMKLSIILSVAALTLAGSALAQPGTDHSGGVIVPYPFNSSDGSTPYAASPGNGQFRVALSQMHLACATERQTLCSDAKSTRAADSCIRYHRSKLSTPCRQAQDRVQLAADGRL